MAEKTCKHAGKPIQAISMKPVVLILALFLIVAALQSCRSTRKLLYHPVPVPEERARHIREAYPDVEQLDIKVAEDCRLHGWFIKKNPAHLPTLLYFGGNAEEVSVNIEMMHRQLNANVIMVNYRGYGNNDGTPTEETLKADALVIHDHIIDSYPLKQDALIACGRSLGSGIAAYVAWKRHLPALILISPYDSIANVAKRHFPGWLVSMALADKYRRTIDFSPDIRSRTLIIASQNDTVIPIVHSRRLFESLTCPKQMVLINKAGHNDFQLHQAYWTALNNFTGTGQPARCVE
ncbi:MAG: hypothetical protein SWH61_07530 [Thermodesulfobacteriota bacterium]|nr:hypothetical protein [Thermodesulfobacteriota bacterium]